MVTSGSLFFFVDAFHPPGVQRFAPQRSYGLPRGRGGRPCRCAAPGRCRGSGAERGGRGGGCHQGLLIFRLFIILVFRLFSLAIKVIHCLHIFLRAQEDPQKRLAVVQTAVRAHKAGLLPGEVFWRGLDPLAPAPGPLGAREGRRGIASTYQQGGGEGE